MEFTTRLDKLKVGDNYLIMYPQDNRGRVELILKYIGSTPDEMALMFSPLFFRENREKKSTLNKWTPFSGRNASSTIKIIPKDLIFHSGTSEEEIEKLHIIFPLGKSGKLVTLTTPPKKIPEIVSTVNKIKGLKKLPSELNDEIYSYLGGRKTKRRKTTRRKTRKSR
jgi:hypothetical protein